MIQKQVKLSLDSLIAKILIDGEKHKNNTRSLLKLDNTNSANNSINPLKSGNTNSANNTLNLLKSDNNSATNTTTSINETSTSNEKAEYEKAKFITKREPFQKMIIMQQGLNIEHTYLMKIKD